MSQQAPDPTAHASAEPPSADPAPSLASSARRRHVWLPILTAVAVGLGYFALARLALLFVAEPSKVAAIWPANGLTLGAMLVARRRVDWVWLLAATVVANTAANVMADRAVAALPALAAANLVEVLIAAGLLSAVLARPIRLASVREVLVFAAVAGVTAPCLSAVIGAISSQYWLAAPTFWDAWWLWLVVDAMGLLVVTPVIVTLAQARRARPSVARAIEAGACLGLAAVACRVIFAGPGEPTVLLLNFPYVSLLPFLLWAGLRFEPWVAALLVAEVVAISGWSTVHRNGPMIQPGFDVVESVVTLQASTMLWGLSALALAGVTAERKAALAAVAESERRARVVGEEAAANHARLQALFDHTTALISTKDLDGRYTHMNAALVRLIGKPVEDLIGKADEDLWPAATVEAIRARDRQLLATGQPIEYETTYLWHGEDRVYHATKFPIRDLAGEITGSCVVSTDITARKRVEDQIRAAKEQADQALAQAEASREQAEASREQAEQARAQAEQARAQAESANRAKSEFLANISHEIRTPLTSIFGYADLLSAPAISAEERLDHVTTIRRNGEHLLAILNDVLDMSKIEAGRMTVERVATAVPPLVADVMSLMRQRALTKSLALEVGCRTPVPAVVQTDPTRFRQVLLNIVGNAVKFTESGRVAIDLWFDESHRSPELVVEVTDTGIGMTPEQVASLGKPFTQGDPGHARRFGGSGLGMSISYRLAELMGGSITCQSRPGAGTTFVVRMPTGDVAGVPRVDSLLEVTDDEAGRGVPPTGDSAFATRPDPAAPVPPPPLSGRVLVAEDAPDTRRLLLIHLKRAGLDVEFAENGQVAVARAVGAERAGDPFDLILMDVQMPQMDGLTATGVLRSHGYTGRIVALTANAMEADRHRCMSAGCDGFLTKPIFGPALVAAVGEYLSQKSGPGRQAAATAATAAVAADAAGTEPAAGDGRPAVGPPTSDRLASELADDPDVGPLLTEYLVELQDKAAALARATEAGEWPEVGRLAHQIKGSAGGYGYPTLTHAAAALEAAVKRPGSSAVMAAATADLLDLCRRATGP